MCTGPHCHGGDTSFTTFAAPIQKHLKFAGADSLGLCPLYQVTRTFSYRPKNIAFIIEIIAGRPQMLVGIHLIHGAMYIIVMDSFYPT